MMNKLIVDPLSKNSVIILRDALSEEIYPIIKSGRTLIILCIGTDRSTGDSLGPLVGHKLKFLIRNKVYLYGNLDNPIHAKNLEKTLKEIKDKFRNPYIIAVDACLGSIQNVGKIIIENKPLTPGSAVNKALPKVGDLSITGIVNISGAMEFMVLQNTRLSIVMQIAEVISRGIYHCILKTIGGKNTSIELENKSLTHINA
ncbi:spore protease YyaC [Clostridium fermenticellae]|uniref:Spore protease YyaC n=1 Tax=Clostridium fermenticellae TaxID=2068654 RepID=A0A386H6L8_9CLOT|nr:spore protease YyaC [Clostridium fermenticellae]AYD41369.1 spore protease YyaC [Clostridium fermenticellae]